MNLRYQGQFSEKRRPVPAQMFTGAILLFQKTIPQQTRKNLV